MQKMKEMKIWAMLKLPAGCAFTSCFLFPAMIAPYRQGYREEKHAVKEYLLPPKYWPRLCNKLAV